MPSSSPRRPCSSSTHSGPSLTITLLQQVEHEANVTLRAARAGVAVLTSWRRARRVHPTPLLVYPLAGRPAAVRADAAR